MTDFVCKNYIDISSRERSGQVVGFMVISRLIFQVHNLAYDKLAVEFGIISRYNKPKEKGGYDKWQQRNLKIKKIKVLQRAVLLIA